jgi:hypothetical protein
VARIEVPRRCAAGAAGAELLHERERIRGVQMELRTDQMHLARGGIDAVVDVANLGG